MLLSKYTVYDDKKLRSIKEKEAGRLLTGLLKVKSHFNGITRLGNIIWRYKANQIVNKCLLAGEKCITGMHLM